MQSQTVALLALLASSRIFAWEPFVTDVSQASFPRAYGGLDHLLPLAPEYRPATIGAGHNTHLARFLARPSFHAGSEFWLERRSTNSSYWLHCVWSESDNGQRIGRDIEIPVELAAVIHDVWVNMLLEVGYSRNPSIGLDGTTYYFSTSVRGLGSLHGQVWSPNEDLPPLWLVNAADYLVQFARDEKRDPAACKQYFDAVRKRIFDYYRTTRLSISEAAQPQGASSKLPSPKTPNSH